MTIFIYLTQNERGRILPGHQFIRRLVHNFAVVYNCRFLTPQIVSELCSSLLDCSAGKKPWKLSMYFF